MELSDRKKKILRAIVDLYIRTAEPGGSKTIVDGAGHFHEAFNKGLFGIGIAGVGMLSTLGITIDTLTDEQKKYLGVQIM